MARGQTAPIRCAAHRGNVAVCSTRSSKLTSRAWSFSLYTESSSLTRKCRTSCSGCLESERRSEALERLSWLVLLSFRIPVQETSKVSNKLGRPSPNVLDPGQVLVLPATDVCVLACDTPFVFSTAVIALGPIRCRQGNVRVCDTRVSSHNIFHNRNCFDGLAYAKECQCLVATRQRCLRVLLVLRAAEKGDSAKVQPLAWLGSFMKISVASR